MRRSITRWTTTLATVGLLGLPVTGFARTQDPTPPPQQPQPTQPQPAPPTQPQPTQPQPAQPQPAQPQPQPTQPQPEPTPPPATATPQQPTTSAVSPQEHLRLAQAAFNSINATSVPKGNRSGLADMKKHLAALETAGSPAGSAQTAQTAPGAAARTKTNWGTEVAAIDKIITDMIGSATAPATSGTTGTPSPTATSGTSSKAAIAIDEATRAKLMEVRTHITAYAAAMSGTATTPKTDVQATTSTVNSEPAASATAAPSPASTAATPAQAAAAPAPSTAAPAPNVAAGATAAPSQVDADAARRHLTAARDTLSQLTQLPAAAQLAGEARVQVTQLIANFNELATTQSNWRASYAKVAANLTALLGPDSGDATAGAPATATGTTATAGVPTTATGTTGTAGAVGTAGATTVELDPAVRAKLVELRRNLVEFQKASGGIDK